MDKHAQQLVRLGQLLNVSAGVLRDLMEVRDFDGETGNLDSVANELDRLAETVNRIGHSGLPLPT